MGSVKFTVCFVAFLFIATRGEKADQTSTTSPFWTKIRKINQLAESRMNEEAIRSISNPAYQKTSQKEKKKNRKRLQQMGESVAEINQHLNVSQRYYQGDIMLTSNQASEVLNQQQNRRKRQAEAPLFLTLWDTVYYNYVNVSAHTINVTELAIAFWQNHTCINFQESSTATPRINIISGAGCYSYVGRIAGWATQDLSLGPGCDSVGTAAHELGHALGFFHEQSRWDRDQYITLYPSNFASGWASSFSIEASYSNNNYGFAYDYGGIMHYSAVGASVPGTLAIVANDPLYQDTMGSQIVSFRDVAEMNAVYCPDRCAGYNTTCYNNGMLHPRDCTKCICPGGFGGNYCQQRPNGCGATLVASSSERIFQATLNRGSSKVADLFGFCNYLITAPAGKRIQAQLLNYTENFCYGGCPYGGVEFKWRDNTEITGSRVCCAADIGEVFTSYFNAMPIIAFNKYLQVSFTVAFKYI